MVHAVRIKDGKASYVNRYVDTARLRQEKEAGYPQFIKVRPESKWGWALRLLWFWGGRGMVST
jgi:carotenoid cleavage dioxygenase-like enzyme